MAENADEPRPSVVLVEAEEIQAMRERLVAVSERVRELSWMSQGPLDSKRSALNAGRVIAALDIAEHTLFTALNVASAALRCPLAEHVLAVAHGTKTRDESMLSQGAS